MVESVMLVPLIIFYIITNLLLFIYIFLLIYTNDLNIIKKKIKRIENEDIEEIYIKPNEIRIKTKSGIKEYEIINIIGIIYIRKIIDKY